LPKQAAFFSSVQTDLRSRNGLSPRDEYTNSQTNNTEGFDDLHSGTHARPSIRRRRQGDGDGDPSWDAGARADLEIASAANDGGDPSSVEFCYRVWLNYVCASPYRVAEARLSGRKGDFRRQSDAMRTARGRVACPGSRALAGFNPTKWHRTTRRIVLKAGRKPAAHTGSAGS